MKLKDILDKDTDKAWESLNQRFKKDGLLELEINSEQPRIHYTKRLMWVASVAALFVGVVLLFMLQDKPVAAQATLVLHNGQGEPTLVTTLEDGSTIFLSEETLIKYPTHFTCDKREVHLSGDAFFDIARNEECPFIIDTENILIEVLGTSFSVKSKGADSFSLSVRSGEVRVTSKITGESSHVKAGQTALFHEEKLQTIPSTNIDKFQTYFNRIYFKDQQLSNVIRIMNERNNDSIQITCQPELTGREITVTLSNESPRDIAEIICAGLNLNYHQKQNTIHITTNTE